MSDNKPEEKKEYGSIFNVFVYLIFVALVIILPIYFLRSCDFTPKSITEHYTCSTLQMHMNYYQGTEVGGPDDVSIVYPSIEDSQIVRKVYEGYGNFGVCTIRMRQPNGEENLYTMVSSIREPISLMSSEREGIGEAECESDPPINPNCNAYGPYNHHFIFLEVLGEPNNE